MIDMNELYPGFKDLPEEEKKRLCREQGFEYGCEFEYEACVLKAVTALISVAAIIISILKG